MLAVRELPQPFNRSVESAIFKSCPEDFVVNEMLTVDFSGQGEHLWLKVKKRNINTAYLATALAKWAKIPARDVGYSGLKDRKAVTTQWFSLRIPKKVLPNATDSTTLNSNSLNNIGLNDDEHLELLEHHWHNKKLNRGTHKRNEFIITLRQVQGQLQQVDNQLSQISALGLPNYFGEQRFGREGNNIERFFEYLAAAKATNTNLAADNQQINTAAKTNRGKRKKTNKRRKNDEQSILISSARSAIFNAILAQRVNDQTWNQAMYGEICNLAGSGSVFDSSTSDASISTDADTKQTANDINERMRTMDIHPTGVLWGVQTDKDKTVTESAPDDQNVQIFEKQLIANDDTLKRLAQGLEDLGIKRSRRPLRLQIHNLQWQWTDLNEPAANTTATPNLRLKFELPTGSYATCVIDSLVSSY